jgi:mannan endo-1,4-beta-mannosidase
MTMERRNTKINALIIWLLFSCYTVAISQTADPMANQTTKCILQYLNSLPSQTNNKVISGQWMNYRGLPETPFSEFDTVITSLYNQTNEWVGIIGTNYTRIHTTPYYIAIENMNQVNQPLINYFKQNGLVFVMTNFKNPWNQTNSNDVTNSINLLDVITNGHPANTNFNKELDSLALGFSQLQDSNVTVIFRPFHEMNGNWFWWGSKTSTLPLNSDYTALWNYTFNYLTIVKGLHNILWCYAPSARESSVGNPAFKPELFYYPGDSLVDIIGLDIYNDTLDIPNYNSIVALNKPVGIAEFGPRKQTVQNNPNVYDYTILINQIRNKYPSLCYWISWNHFKNSLNDWIYYSMVKQNNTATLLNDPWVVNKNEIDYSNCLTTGIEQDNIQNNSINIFPNPISSMAIIESEVELHNAKLTLFNSLGQSVREVKNISGKTIIFYRDNLPIGLYYFWITEDNKQLATKKMIITN